MAFIWDVVLRPQSYSNSNSIKKNKLGRVGRERISWQINVKNGEKFVLLNTILNLPKTKYKYFAENPNFGQLLFR